MNIENKALEVAKVAAEKAGRAILHLYGRVSYIRTKENPTDVYSNADLLADETIFSILSKEFSDFSYLSEEHKFIDKGTNFKWVVDPLDGSIAFISRLEYWGIAIGLIKDNKPIIGVINIPNKKWLFWAKENSGAFLNGDPIRVSDKTDYSKALIGFDIGNRGGRDKDLETIKNEIEDVWYMPSLACSTFGLVLAAKGVYDGYLHHRAYIWDLCAGAVIVKEAGGKVTDLYGKPIDWTQKENIDILASNGVLHSQILGALSLESYGKNKRHS